LNFIFINNLNSEAILTKNLILVTIFSLLIGGGILAGENPLIVQGDTLYHLFDNRGAEAKYLQALNNEPQNAEILWRLSRAEVDIGEHLAENQQEAHFQKALNYADEAIKADAKNPQGYLRRAIALGKIALFKGVFKSISLVKQVKESLDQCLQLNPNEPTAHYVLGRTHQKLCEKPRLARSLLGLGWADEDIGLREFRTAIKLDATFIMYHYDYAKFLLDLKQKEEAKREFKLIADLPIRDEDDANLKSDALNILKDLK
jgi:tetratricopeptide (TPR) repeat protein